MGTRKAWFSTLLPSRCSRRELAAGALPAAALRRAPRRSRAIADSMCATKQARPVWPASAYTTQWRYGKLRWSVPHETPEGVEMVPEHCEKT